MPSYQVPYARRPYQEDTSRLSELIQQRGRDQAEGLRRVGDIQAQRALTLGQLLTGAVQQIGAIPEQMRVRKREDLQDTFATNADARAAEEARLAAEDQTFRQSMSRSAEARAQGQAAREAESHALDVAEAQRKAEAEASAKAERDRLLTARTAAEGALSSGRSRDAVLGSLQGSPEAYQYAAKHYQSMDEQMARLMGTVAATVKQFGSTPEAAAAALDDLAERGFDPKQLDGLRQRFQQDPAHIEQVISGLLKASPDEAHRNLAKRSVMEANANTNVIDTDTGQVIGRGPRIQTAAESLSSWTLPEWTRTPDRPTPSEGNVFDPVTGRTPNAIFEDAIRFALEGKNVPTGRGGTRTVATQAAIESKASAIARLAGVSLSELSQEFRANTAATSRMTNNVRSTLFSAAAAEDNLKAAAQAMAESPNTWSPAWNKIQNAFRNQTGVGGLSKQEALIYAAVREYSKVATGTAGSVAPPTDKATATIERLMSSSQSPDQMAATVDAMTLEMGNMTRRQVQELRKQSPLVARFLTAATGRELDVSGDDVINREPSAAVSHDTTASAPTAVPEFFASAPANIQEALKNGKKVKDPFTGQVWMMKNGQIVRVP